MIKCHLIEQRARDRQRERERERERENVIDLFVESKLTL